MTTKCKHPVESREWQDVGTSDAKLICGLCKKRLNDPEKRDEDGNDDLFSAAAEPAELPAGAEVVLKSCDRAGVCLHAGEDCTLEGAEGREYGCFESVTSPGEEPEPPKCINRQCPSQDDSFADGCAVPGHEGRPVSECGSYVSSELSDTTEKAEPATYTSAETSRPFIRRLPVGLAEDELAEKGEEMARQINIWTRSKMDLKKYTKAAKEVIDKAEEQYINLALEIEAGTEERDVQCFWRFNAPAGTKTLYRCDTGDEVETTAMTAEEMQQDFDFQAERSIENVAAMSQEGAQDAKNEAQEKPAGETQEIASSERENASELANGEAA